MLFELKAVRKRFGAKLALDLPELKLEEGKPVVFYGPNGSGKTTLLSLLAGLDEPTEGTVRFAGGRRDVTLVEQDPYLFSTTLLGNVVLGLRYRGISEREAAAAAKPYLERLGLWDMRGRGCAGFSAGERRRAALARGMALGTKALLLDEPMANLDRAFVAATEKLIAEEAAKPGRTVLMATHDLAAAVRLGAEVVYLSDGRLSPVPLWGGVRQALGPGFGFFVSTGVLGPATVSIDPRDVLLSLKPIDSSALNCVLGRIASASTMGLEVDVVVDAGWRLHAFITPKSFGRMGLKPGDEVYVTFKATAVRVLEEGQ
ncbi:MAG: ABC transporter ATP-binding protein [Elusimicrobia bacterium]|nr:ABC transporter ATP-binding protein [Elusimicrobiota bacterium]